MTGSDVNNDINQRIFRLVEDTIFYIVTKITDFRGGDIVEQWKGDTKDLRSFTAEIAVEFNGYFSKDEIKKSIAAIIEFRRKLGEEILTEADSDTLYELENETFNLFFGGSFPVFGGISGNGYDDACDVLIPKIIETYTELYHTVK